MQGTRRLVPVNPQLHKQVPTAGPNVCQANWKEMYYRALIGKTEQGDLLFNVDSALSNALEPNDDVVPCPPLFIFSCVVTYDLHSLLHDHSAYGLVSTRASTAPSHLSHARLDYEHQIMMQLRPQLPVMNSFITSFRKMIPKGVTIAVTFRSPEGQYPEQFCFLLF
ncbi:hypothetical protein DFS33DRAFT_1329681 [Desarmillaria ectypa]|nr:hypothetical protein DFS33DRAFT_1329681 [Desarmillaria ectypa]